MSNPWFIRATALILMLSALNGFAGSKFLKMQVSGEVDEAEELTEAAASCGSDLGGAPGDVQIRIAPIIALSGLEENDLRSLSRKDRGFIQQMKEEGFFDNWSRLQSGVPIELSSNTTFVRTDASANDAPEFILNGKKYVLPIPGYRQSARVAYQTAKTAVKKAALGSRLKLALASATAKIKASVPSKSAVKKWSKRSLIAGAALGAGTVFVLYLYNSHLEGVKEARHQQLEETEGQQRQELRNKVVAATKLADMQGKKGLPFLQEFFNLHVSLLSADEAATIASHANSLQFPSNTDPYGHLIPEPTQYVGDEILRKYYENHPNLSVEDLEKFSAYTHDEKLKDFFFNEAGKKI